MAGWQVGRLATLDYSGVFLASPCPFQGKTMYDNTTLASRSAVLGNRCVCGRGGGGVNVSVEERERDVLWGEKTC